MIPRTLIAIACMMLLLACQPAKPLPKLFSVPEFTLVESKGQPIKRSDLLGKVWVANFFFATCPGICKELNSGMRELDKTYAGESRFRLVSFTTDAEHDTPEVLAAYAKTWSASDQWHFVTGPKANLYQLSIGGFKLALQENAAAAESIIHSGKMVLVDKTGNIRGYYDGTADPASGGAERVKTEQKRLAADIRRLLAE